MTKKQLLISLIALFCLFIFGGFIMKTLLGA